jgi:hypothetical protein
MEIDVIKLDSAYRRALANCPRTLDFFKAPPLNQPTNWFKQHTEAVNKSAFMSLERVYDHDFYILETHNFVQQYTEELKVPIKVVFGKQRKPVNISVAALNFAHAVSRLYVSEVPERRFDNIATKDAHVLRGICKDCSQGSFAAERESDAFVTCTSCGLRRMFPHFHSNYGDSKRINLSQKNTSDKRNHFINCFNQHTYCKIPLDIEKKIEARIEQYGLVDPGDMREVKFKRVTREHIKLIIRDLGLTKDCSDIAAYRVITGQSRLEIARYKENVIHDFDIFNDLYNKNYPGEDKKPFNYQQLLFQFLRRRGYQCDPKDFNFLKTTERKAQHDQIYGALFKELGWNYTPLF